MRHIFIVNPISGPKDNTADIQAALSSLSERKACEIYVTQAPGDATSFVRSVCESSREPVRFYSCGGDGTLNEVVNGAAGHAHAAVGCFPCGSGNDFVKYFGGRRHFVDLEKQLRAPTDEIDLISVNGRYAVNIVNFGFDALAAYRMTMFRRFPLLRGQRAYYAATALSVVDGLRHRCRVTVDDEPVIDGDLLLCTVANAEYMGGSFRCAPRADLHDGLLEVSIVTPISRLRLARIISIYQRGEHLDDPRFADCLTYRRGRKIEVETPKKDFLLCMDGEIITGDHFVIEVKPRALRLILPEGAAHTGKRLNMQEEAAV